MKINKGTISVFFCSEVAPKARDLTHFKENIVQKDFEGIKEKRAKKYKI